MKKSAMGLLMVVSVVSGSTAFASDCNSLQWNEDKLILNAIRYFAQTEQSENQFYQIQMASLQSNLDALKVSFDYKSPACNGGGLAAVVNICMADGTLVSILTTFCGTRTGTTRVFKE